MAREHSSSRRSKSHSSKRKICKFPHCDGERKSKTHNGETTTSKYCEKHSDQTESNNPAMPASRKTSADTSTYAFPNERSAFATPTHPRHLGRPFSMPVPCYFPKCHFQDCNRPINAVSKTFCSEHERVVYSDVRFTHSRPLMEYFPPSPPLSPLSMPVRGIVPSEEHPHAPTSINTTDVTDGSPTSIQSITVVETAPAPVTTPAANPIAAPVETKTESKVETVKHAVEQGKHQEWSENDGFPTFFSGVGVGLCILLQIIHVLLRLLLELARGMGKRGMW